MSWQTDLDKLAIVRLRMVERQLRTRGIGDERLLAAMAAVPRHEFVDRSYRDQAYEDRPIPIGEDQTISQPYIVAVSLDALALQSQNTVLEIGTGTGYQTAILAELVSHVDSVERRQPLAEKAEAILSRLGYANVTINIGDGTMGLPGKAPFDAIVVSAAAPGVPPALFEQLREGGRMVIPVGPIEAQKLLLVRKLNSMAAVTSIEGCRFVPLIGEQGFPAT